MQQGMWGLLEMSAPSKPDEQSKSQPVAGRLRNTDRLLKDDAHVSEGDDVSEVEWLPAKSAQPNADDDAGGESGSGAIEVRAAIGEGGLFVANSYAKIQFELGVSVEEMLQKQAQAKAKRAHTEDGKSPFVSASDLDTEKDVGVEIQDTSHDDYEVDMDFGQTGGRNMR